MHGGVYRLPNGMENSRQAQRETSTPGLSYSKLRDDATQRSPGGNPLASLLPKTAAMADRRQDAGQR